MQIYLISLVTFS